MGHRLTRWLPAFALAAWSVPVRAQSQSCAPASLAAAPSQFILPPLHPRNATLATKRIGEGVYALISSVPGVNNGGFVVGERGVLVIDAGINQAMGEQIVAAVREVTSLPILYVVLTTYHGDHTFGSEALPATAAIVAHSCTAALMRDIEAEKTFLLPMVRGDSSVYMRERPRLPTETFTDHRSVDLGGRTVELWHAGVRPSQGDVVVYESRTQTAWTGNFVVGPIPFLLSAGADEFLRSTNALRQRFKIKTIVSGHIYVGSGTVLDAMAGYLATVRDSSRASVARHETAEALIARFPLPAAFVPEGTSQPLASFFVGLHALALQRSHREAIAQR